MAARPVTGAARGRSRAARAARGLGPRARGKRPPGRRARRDAAEGEVRRRRAALGRDPGRGGARRCLAHGARARVAGAGAPGSVGAGGLPARRGIRRVAGIAALPGQVVASVYRATFAPGAVDPRALRAAADALLRAHALPRERQKGQATVRYDLRPFLDTLEVDDGDGALRMTLRHDPERGIGRPEEVLAALGEQLDAVLEPASIVREGLVLAPPPPPAAPRPAIPAPRVSRSRPRVARGSSPSPRHGRRARPRADRCGGPSPGCRRARPGT